MANDPILYLLGLAKKAGKLELGEEPVGAVCRSHHARVILLAADAAPNTCRRAAHFGQTGNALWLQLPQTKDELGFHLGRKSCAMLAVTDFGLAAAVAEKLAAAEPERYGPAAEQLRAKADRALQRQKEKRQHEKNVQRGKKKPWAAPPKEQESASGKAEAPKKADSRRRPAGPAAGKSGRPAPAKSGRPAFSKTGRPAPRKAAAKPFSGKKPGVKSAAGGKKPAGMKP